MRPRTTRAGTRSSLQFDDRDLVILHTSTPSFGQDIRTAALIKERNPKIMIGFIGAKVAVEPRQEPRRARRMSISSRARNMISRSWKSPQGKPLVDR